MRQQIEHLTQLMRMHAGPVTAMRRAIAMVANTLNNQAQLLAYIDIFRYLAFACAGCVLVTFILRKTQARRGMAE